MKQKKFGKKVINWRPISAGEFLIHSLMDPSPRRRGYYSGIVTDECWDPCDPYWTCSNDNLSHDLAPDFKSSFEATKEYVRRILNRPALFALDERTPKKFSETSEKAPRPQFVDGNSTRLESRLAEFFTNINDFSRNPKALQTQIEKSLADPRDRRMLKIAAEQRNNSILVVHVGLFSPFWLRSPRTWDQHSNFLDHVFARHPVPQFLHRNWGEELDCRFKWLIWFILFGQGGSLKKAGDLFGWRIPPRLPEYLKEEKGSAPKWACIGAEVKRLGGSHREVFSFKMNSGLFDPTEPPEDKDYVPFWLETVRWFITHREDIPNVGMERSYILRWAIHEYTEAKRAGNPRFSWKGRQFHTILERSYQYQREIARPWPECQWRSYGWDWEVDDPSLGAWSCVELTSGEDLYLEGLAMNHCVAGYAGRCAAGHSAIVSLRHNKKHRLTVEIHPRTKTLVQARGTFNRQAKPEEHRVLSQWMGTVVERGTSDERRKWGVGN